MAPILQILDDETELRLRIHLLCQCNERGMPASVSVRASNLGLDVFLDFGITWSDDSL